MGVSTLPSLDLACPQAKAEIEKYVHMFRDRGVDKINMDMITSRSFLEQQHIYCHMISYAKVTIYSQCQV